MSLNTVRNIMARYIFLLPFLFFSALVLFEIRQTAFLYDSAIHIDAARYLAYPPSHITPSIFELLSTTTSGPVLSIAGALTTAITGNHWWTASLAAASLNLLIFLFFIFRLDQITNNRSTVLTLTFCLLFLILSLQWWTFFLGEMPSILLFFVASTFVIDSSLSANKRYSFTAITLALSLRAKLITLPMIGGLVIYLAIEQWIAWYKHQKNIALIAKEVLLACIVFFITYCVFYFVDYSIFCRAGSNAYIESWLTKKAFISGNSAMGIGKLLAAKDPLAEIFNNILRNYDRLASYTTNRLGAFNAIVFLLAGTLLGCFTLTLPKKPIDKLLAIFFLSLLVTSIWFFVINQSFFERYTVTISCLALTLTALCIYRCKPIAAPLALGALIFLSPKEQQTQFLQTLTFQKSTAQTALLTDKYNQNIQETAQYLSKNTFDIPLAKCGWMSAAWSIDYLLPEDKFITDCYLLMRDAISTQTNQSDSTQYTWTKSAGFILITDKLTWKFAKFNAISRPIQKIVMDACKKQVLYENETFRVMHCSEDAIRTAINPNTMGEFVDKNPIWKR